jgi:peptidoglycan/xylan/chitin deacetylase (PgdA/CDA1 family)
MRNLLVFVFAAAMVITLVSCNNNAGPPETGSLTEHTKPVNERIVPDNYILDNSKHIRIPAENPVQVFSSGHGWKKIYGMGSFSDDAGDCVKNDRSLKLVTTGDKKGNSIRKTGAGITDFTSRYPVIQLKVDNVKNLESLYFTISSSDYSAGYYSWSLKSQLQLSRDYNHDNEWLPLSLSFNGARLMDKSNRNAISSYELKCTDSGSAVTVRLGSIGYFDEAAEGIVSITFDDGWLSQFTEAKRKMDECGFAGTVYIIKDKVGTADYMTVKQLKELQDVSGWSISCHGSTSYTGMTETQLDDYFGEIKRHLAKNGLTSGMDDVSYPNGAADSIVFEKVKKYFRSGRSITESPEYYPPVNPYSLRIKNVVMSTPVSEIEEAVANAIKEKEWLILCFHKIEPSPAVETEYSIAEFEKVIDSIYNSGIKVRNVAEVLSGEY